MEGPVGALSSGPPEATITELTIHSAAEKSHTNIDVDLERGGHDAANEKTPLLGESEEPGQSDNVLYLAYGSNLAAKTFLGKRGIKPLSRSNVVVPELSLSFDLPGIPYSEPCFANTRRRDPRSPQTNGALQTRRTDYHKDRWKKGLVGVVYEVTPKDYATIIATEGGGSSYDDVLVQCFPLDSPDTVPMYPGNSPFKAHTLFAQDKEASIMEKQVRRPDPSYAQPSARYLKLLTDGAAENDLPHEYREYLADIRPYTITSTRQKCGRSTLLGLWMPLLLLVFKGGALFADKRGRFPAWFAAIGSAVFRGVWLSYDWIFKPMFGDGERTMGLDDGVTQKGVEMA